MMRPLQGRLMPPLPATAAVDHRLLVAVGLIIALGLVMVGSASIPIADRDSGEPFSILIRQAAQLGVGLLLALGAVQVPLAAWYRASPFLLAGSAALLIAVLIPGIGREVNGSMRWINLGVANIQASEVAKLGVLIYLAGYLQRHGAALRTSMMAMLRPLMVLSVVAVLLLLEPDFGAAVVVLGVALGMVFLAGVNFGRFTFLLGTTMTAMALVLYASPYRRARLASFLDPWADPYNAGFQLTHSLIAIGRGELFGVGLGASVQKLFYLPEAHTDFIFAVLAEELGLMGICLVIGLYAVVVLRAFAIGRHATRLDMGFGAAIAYGVGLWIAFQAMISIGVNMGVLPTKGLTLPLISYGGSSAVVMCIAVALLLRVDMEARANDPVLQRHRDDDAEEVAA